MTSTLTESSATTPLLLPEHPRRFGPVSRILLTRLIVAVGIVHVVGALLIFATDSSTARAIGVSLVYPGAGFVYTASPVLFAITQILLVVALVLWWGVSTHFSIPLVWALGALGAGWLADGPRVWVDRGTTWDLAVPLAYLLFATIAGTMVWKFERRFRAKRAKVSELNDYLRTAQLPEPTRVVRRPDAVDADLLRWCYDFAFQPDDGLDGLEWGEQFHGGTQLRYQLNSIAWAMALYAANLLPNAPERIEQALAKVVDKHTDLRVWRYWRTLNLLGNFDPNPDPIRRDNIMFSAFLGDVINTYEAATGSTRFDEPGSLTFVWSDGRTFAYDHHTITAAVRANFERSRLGFFPCEPGWSFTVCNVMGAQALHGHDVLHATSDWETVRDRWRRTLDEEYLTPDGSYAHIRSNHVGLSWDTGEVPGGHYHANGTHRFLDILPEHARRAKALDLRGVAPKMKALAGMVRDGRLELELPPEPERHHTSSSSLIGWNRLIGAARMAGEHDLVTAALDAAARQCTTGRRWPDRPLAVGGSGLGSHMLLRWTGSLDLAGLNMRGYVAPVGPVLRDVCDDVIVTFARSDDGVALDLSLMPSDDGREHEVRCLARLEQLRPGTDYAVRRRDDGTTVARISADHSGTAQLDMTLRDFVELVVRPEAAS